MTSFSPRLFVVALFLGGFVFSGCGAARDVEVTERGVQATDVRTGDGVGFGDDVVIPETYPADFPKYPGARTQGFLQNAEEGTYSANQQTGDGVADVKAWAERVMTANGYTKTLDMVDPMRAVVSFEKGGVRYQVQAARDEARSLTYIITVRNGR